MHHLISTRSGGQGALRKAALELRTDNQIQNLAVILIVQILQMLKQHSKI